MSTTDQLLSEFIDAWNAGARPRVREYLARLPDGPARDELAEQLSNWLEVAPTPAYDTATRAQIAAEPAVTGLFTAANTDAGMWPTLVPRLRDRAGLSLTDLAGQLVDRFSLDRQDSDRTAGYLDRLERGTLDPARVSRRLTQALAHILGVGERTFADAATYQRAFRAQPAAAGGTLFRGAPAPAAPAQLEADFGVLSRAARAPAPPPLDELDRLFTGGPDA
jgi:transcriptional regulator with XRE-family HTH domain